MSDKCNINEVIKVLSKTKSGKMIFHDCFIPIAVRPDFAAIHKWIEILSPMDDDWVKVLKGYLKWSKGEAQVHPVGGNDE